MSQSVIEHEAPDMAGRAARAGEGYEARTEDMIGEKMVLNVGPSHPATHGVLRLVLELDGEILTKAEPDVGFLHRGDEKIAENMHYNQFVPYTDRLDYLAPLSNNVAYACAVEKLMGWTLPPRGQAVRVICCELSRISSHLLGIGVYAMDVGAMTVFLYTFNEREKVYNICEELTGARFTTSYTRIGGMIRDISPRVIEMSRQFIRDLPPVIDEIDKLLSRNRIFMDRTVDIGTIFKGKGDRLRADGAESARLGSRSRSAQGASVSRLREP